MTRAGLGDIISCTRAEYVKSDKLIRLDMTIEENCHKAVAEMLTVEQAEGYLERISVLGV